MKGTLLVLFVLFTIFSLCESQVDYGIMIDAGSSGSRVYLYEWPHRDDPSLPLVEPTTINQVVINKKINTPLASFANNVSYAGQSLEPLIDYVKLYLSSSRYSSTPIYLKATAGMRAISIESQNAIIENVRLYLATTPFSFKPEYAKVIPGTDEGVFGWITVNYLLKVLQNANPTTYGALDMGGASTQITFSPASKPIEYNFTGIFSKRYYELYTYSYPLGQDQAGRLIIAGLVTDNAVDGEGNILNPCYLVGYNETNSDGKKIVGTGIYDQCKAAVLKYVVQPDSSCSACGMGSVYQPDVTGIFYAFSGFAYTFKFFGLPNNASIAQLRTAGQAYCDYTYSEAQTVYPSPSDAAFLKTYCFTSTYLAEVLNQYGFADDSHDLVVTAAVGETEVTWALGGMIYEANLLPINTTSTAKPTSSANSVMASSFTLLLLALILLLQ